MMFSLTAYNAAGDSLTSSDNNSTDNTSQALPDVSSTTENSSDSIASTAEISQPEQSSSITKSSITTQPHSEPKPEMANVLAAYFSATNTAESVAYNSDALNAYLYEIIPAIPYTSAALDYRDNGSRSAIEMNEPSSRPKFSNSVSNMEQYDVGKIRTLF